MDPIRGAGYGRPKNGISACARGDLVLMILTPEEASKCR